MEAISSIDGLPPELLMEVLSLLSWRQQMIVRRVSRRWQAAADACLARRQELVISEDDNFGNVMSSPERLLNALQSMPGLRRLRCVRLSWDQMSVERLCTSCPHLQVVSLKDRLNDASVETLLRRLLDLRAFHLSNAAVKGACLSLLPSGLQSLSLRCARFLYQANLRHLTRCPQLRQLDLSSTNVNSEGMVTVLTVCPQLERLAVAGCNRLNKHWLPELSRCSKLRELDITGQPVKCRHSNCINRGPMVSNDDPLDMLITFSSLERLRIAGKDNPLSTLRTMSLSGLTHLDISRTKTNDTVFCQLPDMLPGLRHLILSGCDNLTANGLASVLPRFTSLEVLDISYMDMSHDSLSTDALLSSLSGLPLKALAYDCFGGRISDVIRCCPTLTLVRTDAGDASQVVAELARDPIPENRQVTLIVEEETPYLTSQLPKNIRVVKNSVLFDDSLSLARRWDKLVGWI